MGLDRYHKTPCGFCFVEYYTHQDALDCLKYIGGTKLDERIIRADLDPGFEEGRQYGYVEQHWQPLHGTRGYCFLTGKTGEASLVARCAMSTAKNTILAVEVTVEHTMISADGKKKSMGKVSKRDLGFDLLAHRRRLYKDNFHQQKAEMKKEKEVYLIPTNPCKNLYQCTNFTSQVREPGTMLFQCSSSGILPLGATTMNVSWRLLSVRGGSSFRRHCLVGQQ